MSEISIPETSLELVTLANHIRSFGDIVPIVTTRPVKARRRNFFRKWHFSHMAVSGRLVQIKDISLAAYIINQYRLSYVFYAS